MSTLLLVLAGPLQSWGDSSRFVRRSTREVPTKSGVLGLLAAAQGRRRTDPIEDLVELCFGVRTDQPGTLTRDFQTARRWTTGKSLPLSYRFYLADAVFLVGLEAKLELLQGLEQALRNPTFPLYLGRRSCPPSRPIVLGIRDTGLSEALHNEPWQAAKWYRKKQSQEVSLPIVRDAFSNEPAHGTVADIPISFDSRHRKYGLRDIVHERTKTLSNLDGYQIDHDPFALVGGA